MQAGAPPAGMTRPSGRPGVALMIQARHVGADRGKPLGNGPQRRRPPGLHGQHPSHHDAVERARRHRLRIDHRGDGASTTERRRPSVDFAARTSRKRDGREITTGWRHCSRGCSPSRSSSRRRRLRAPSLRKRYSLPPMPCRTGRCPISAVTRAPRSNNHGQQLPQSPTMPWSPTKRPQNLPLPREAPD